MNHKIKQIFFLLTIFTFAAIGGFAQETAPTPASSSPKATKTKGNRTSNVRIRTTGDTEDEAVDTLLPASSPPEKPDKIKKLEQEKIEQAAAAEKTLERERENLRKEADEREHALKEKFAADKTAQEQETEKLREKLASEAESRRLAEEQSERDGRARLTAENDVIKARQEAEKQIREGRDAAQKQIETARLDAETKAAEEKQAAENRLKLETAQQEEARRQAEAEAGAVLLSATADKEKLRHLLIVEKARLLGYLAPAEAVSLVPPDINEEPAIEEFLRTAANRNQALVKVLNYCSPDFVGEKFTFDVPSQQSLATLLNEIRIRFGVNFLPDSEIVDQSVQINVNDVPWNFVLKSQLFNLDVEAVCYGTNTVSLIKRSKLLILQDSERKTAPVKTEYIKLKYLRPVIGGQSNLAGKATNTASIESLEQTIQKILSSGGDTRGSISRIPGRAEFFITATDTQLDQIRQVIAKADRPTYRVDVFGLVYTISDSRLKDVGSQLSLIVRSGGRVGGLTTLPDPPQTGGDGTTPTETRGLPPQFAQPGGLQAGAPNTILGAQVRLGLVDFNYQLSLLEQLGVARRVEKPFVSAKDGTTGTFENGTQIPVVIQSLNNFGNGGGGTIEFINAGTTLSVTPQVIENAEGNPQLVNLALRLESNTPDLSIQTTGGVPSVNSRRIQNEITIAPNQAFIFGGANDVFDANNVSRTPVLGNIPILGNLFRRKTTRLTDNKLYFAVWVQISLDDGSSPVETDTLNTTFPKPPKMDAPLTLPEKKP